MIIISDVKTSRGRLKKKKLKTNILKRLDAKIINQI